MFQSYHGTIQYRLHAGTVFAGDVLHFANILMSYQKLKYLLKIFALNVLTNTFRKDVIFSCLLANTEHNP